VDPGADGTDIASSTAASAAMFLTRRLDAPAADDEAFCVGSRRRFLRSFTLRDLLERAPRRGR